MAGARFIVTTLLAFLLLSPFIKTLQREVEKPVIVIATDNSESILFNKDSAYYKNEFPKAIQSLAEKLGEDFTIQSYSFGDQVKNNPDFSYTQKQTDLSSLFTEIETRFSNRNLGAVILASDGLYNKGSNPVFSSSVLKAPVYTIALGDTTIKKDVILTDVRHNSMAFLGNDFPLQAVINVHELTGSKTTLNVSKTGKNLFSQTIDINKENFNTEILVHLTADAIGIQHYSITLTEVKGENTIINNKRDIYINVLDARQKILILSNAPHPDITAIKQSISNTQTYEVEDALTSEFTGVLKKYNLVIAHKFQASNNNIITELEKLSIPTLFIGGNIPEAQSGLRISLSANKTNESEAALLESFNLFTVSDGLSAYIKNFPAIQCPFGNYSTSNSMQVLLNQKIGMVTTNSPLMAFNQKGDWKTGIIAGEGIWRWRLRDYADNNKHDHFNELIHKTIQYLSVKADRNFFRITGKNNFMDNEAVELDAEVYNESYELINDPEVNITITNTDTKKFQFSFYKTGNAYRLNAGAFPAGEYTYEAQVKIGEKIYKKTGQFSVSPVVIESVNTVADHKLLFNLSKKNGGEMVYPADIEKLADTILKREDIKTVSYTQKKLTDLIQFKWLFILLLTLLSLEWFLRKRNGAY